MKWWHFAGFSWFFPRILEAQVGRIRFRAVFQRMLEKAALPILSWLIHFFLYCLYPHDMLWLGLTQTSGRARAFQTRRMRPRSRTRPTLIPMRKATMYPTRYSAACAQPMLAVRQSLKDWAPICPYVYVRFTPQVILLTAEHTTLFFFTTVLGNRTPELAARQKGMTLEHCVALPRSAVVMVVVDLSLTCQNPLDPSRNYGTIPQRMARASWCWLPWQLRWKGQRLVSPCWSPGISELGKAEEPTLWPRRIWIIPFASEHVPCILWVLWGWVNILWSRVLTAELSRCQGNKLQILRFSRLNWYPGISGQIHFHSGFFKSIQIPIFHG